METKIKWTKNPNRISIMFVKEHERRFTIYSFCEKISFNLKENESMEETRARIGFLLAGQPIRETYNILKKYL